jgi:hypothetical protein
MTTVLSLCTADHVLRDARLSDLETELEQLAMDARCKMEFSVHTTQRKLFLSAERANYRFFCFAKITFQLSL